VAKFNQRASSAPTSLLSHPMDGSSANCLAKAVRFARDGVDEIVFLSAPRQAEEVGHVVLRDARTGIVREPGGSVEQGDPASIEHYLQAGGRRLIAMLPAALVRGLLRLAPPKRATALAELGEPLCGMAHLAFGIAVPPVLPPTNTGNGAIDNGNLATEATDKHVAGWLSALGNAVSDDDKKALAQNGNDAATVAKWLDSGGTQKGMPQAVADAEKRLQANDAVNKWVTDKGQITKSSIDKFLKNLDSSADSAKSSWQAFQKDNKTPDPLAQQEAVDASILQGNATILDQAGSNAKVDQKFNVDDLNAVASGSNDSQLPAALKNAAAFYANSGEFSAIATAGLDPSATSDGTIKNSNLDTYLSKDTSKTEDETIAGLKSAAIQQAVTAAGGDASKLDPSYFTTGQSNASGADKAAALIQLSQTIGRYNQGVSEYQYKGPDDLSSPTEYNETYGAGPTPGQQSSDFINSVKDRITTLTKDPDVQTFLANNMPGALSRIVQSDPGMAAAAKTQYAAATSTQALVNDFGQKDSSGKPVSTTDALASFVGRANFYSQALNLGTSGNTSNYNSALSGAPQDIKDQVTQQYQYITSGNQISDLVKGGMSEDQAINQSASDKTAYDSVLDPAAVQAGTDQFGEVVGTAGRNQLTDGQSISDMLKGLGIGSGSIDDPADAAKFQQIITDNLNLLTAPGGTTPSAADVVTALRQLNDSMRGGLKFDDAMAKAESSWTSIAPDQASTAYKAGVFHVLSGALLGGAMITRLASGQPGATLPTVGQAFNVAGLLTEGGAKSYAAYYKSTVDGLKTAVAADQLAVTNAPNDEARRAAQATLDADNAKLNPLQTIPKAVENVGKALGGVVGNSLGFIAGIIGAAHAGDTADAAVQGVFAGLNGISTVATAGEVATYVLNELKVLAPSDLSWSALGGVFGAVGGAVGGIAAVGGLIYSIIKSIQADNQKSKDEDAWYKQIVAGFAPSGITVPDEGTLLAPPNGTVDNSNPPAEP
jgi:hypothetical protein